MKARIEEGSDDIANSVNVNMETVKGKKK